MLEWSEPQAPDGVKSYFDHVEAITPLGVIKIQWNSWSDADNYSCVLPWKTPDGYTTIVRESSLEYAKIRVGEEFAKLAARINSKPVPRHKVRWDVQKRCRKPIHDYYKTLKEWDDFTPECRGGSPMEARDDMIDGAEADMLDSILEVLKEYGLEFSK